MKTILSIAICLAPFLISAQQLPKSLTATNGTFIGFYEYKPIDYAVNPDTRYPVIIFLHGIGERGNGTSQLSSVLANAIPKYINAGHPMRFFWNGKWETFLVLSPQLSSSYGSWPTFYVEEMIKYAKNNLKIDTNRIFLTGLSLGGGGVWQYASTSLSNAKNVAAIAPVCGTCAMQNACNIAGANLPVWAFHAQDDGTVGVGCTTGAINSILACNPSTKPLMNIYPTGGHGIWDRSYDTVYSWHNPNMYEWFLGQNKSLPANILPVAKAGNDITISSTTAIANLSGISSRDADGTILRYIWRSISGNGSGIILSPVSTNGLTEITSLTTAGIYSYELTVVDNRAAISKDTVIITVVSTPTTNIPPVAIAGTDLTTVSSTIPLNGGNTYDPDGVVVSYDWNQISGPSSSTISNPASITPLLSNLTSGTYQFLLTARDNQGAIGKDTITIYSSAITLPMKFTYTGARSLASGNQITWITSGEFNNDYFDIEFSNDGVAFTRLSKVNSLGNSQQGHTYHYIHTNAPKAISYYRIQQVDISGASSYSPIFTSVPRTTINSLQLSPNPAKESITIVYNQPGTGNLQFRIFSADGRLQLQRSISKMQEVVIFPLAISQLSTGAYFLQAILNGKAGETKYFIKN